jgi:glutathione S-transferase
MKLYGAPGACSMSCHIALEESKIPFEASIAKFEERQGWQEIERLNPQGAVPVLVLDDGKVLTQNIAILTYVAERAPAAKLLPEPGTLERAQAYQWLSWVASDLHKAFGLLFNDATPEEAKKQGMASILDMLSQAERHLEGKEFLVGGRFGVADAYFFTVYGWSKWMDVPTDGYKNLNAYAGRILERPAVRAAMKREGLI